MAGALVMCSVIGYSSQAPKDGDLDLLIKIFEESRIRGLHAFGFSYVHGILVHTVKSNDFAHLMEELKAIWPVKSLIGHCRYSTSGDFREAANNQPVLKIGINAALVFNGVISMKTKAEMEQDFNIVMETENDGELALRSYVEKPQEFPGWLRKLSASFAGIFLVGDKMIAFRNSRRPLWSTARNGSAFIASTADILKRSGLKQSEIICLPAEIEWRVS